MLASTDLAAVPLFLLMGVFASMAGFSEDVYRAAAAFLGHRRGGLAYATIMGGGVRRGLRILTATAATFSKVALPQMLDRGYSPAFSTGTIAAGRNAQVADPALAGDDHLLRGREDFHSRHVRRRDRAGADHHRAQSRRDRRHRAAHAEVAPVSERMAWPERFARPAPRGAVPRAAVGVFVGIYSGVFTVNEAASAAAVLALVFAVLRGAD